jgi:hypothetical protein
VVVLIADTHRRQGPQADGHSTAGERRQGYTAVTNLFCPADHLAVASLSGSSLLCTGNDRVATLAHPPVRAPRAAQGMPGVVRALWDRRRAAREDSADREDGRAAS